MLESESVEFFKNYQMERKQSDFFFSGPRPKQDLKTNACKALNLNIKIIIQKFSKNGENKLIWS